MDRFIFDAPEIVIIAVKLWFVACAFYAWLCYYERRYGRKK